MRRPARPRRGRASPLRPTTPRSRRSSSAIPPSPASASPRPGRASAACGSGRRTSTSRRSPAPRCGPTTTSAGPSSSSTPSAASSSAPRSPDRTLPSCCIRQRSLSSARCRWTGCGMRFPRTRPCPRCGCGCSSVSSGSSAGRSDGSARCSAKGRLTPRDTPPAARDPPPKLRGWGSRAADFVDRSRPRHHRRDALHPYGLLELRLCRTAPDDDVEARLKVWQRVGARGHDPRRGTSGPRARMRPVGCRVVALIVAARSWLHPAQRYRGRRALPIAARSSPA